MATVDSLHMNQAHDYLPLDLPLDRHFDLPLPLGLPRDRERGAILIIVMMVMLGLLGLGVTALWLTSGNMQMGANINLRQQALYVAEAGIENAKEVLNGPTPPNLTFLLSGSAFPQDNRPTGVDANGKPNGIGVVMVESPGSGLPLQNVAYPPASFARGGGTANAPTSTTMGNYTVWIRNDTADLREANIFQDTNQSIVVRSQGVASDNRTNVVLEVTLGPDPSGAGGPGLISLPPQVLCNSGKNACDDNNSTQYGVVVN